MPHVWAQDPYFLQIDKTKGLPSNSVFNSFQDSRGFMWFAHKEGLSRYDGHEFVSYSCEQQTSKAGSYIKEDTYGRIWYRNFDGYLYFVQNDSMYELPMSKPFGFSMYGIIRQNLFVLEAKGVLIYDLGTLKPKNLVKINTETFSSSCQSENKFYVMTQEYIYTFDQNGSVDSINLSDAPFSNVPVGLGCASTNTVLLISRDQSEKSCFQLTDEKINFKFTSNVKGYIQGIEFCGTYYWFCTANGVYAYTEKGSSINANNTPLFSQKNISQAYKDNRGNYWFSTTNEGVLFVPNLFTRMVQMKDEKPNMLFADKGYLYIGTRSGKLNRLDFLTNSYKTIYSLPREILQLYIDSSNKKILLTSNEFSALSLEGTVIWRSAGAIKEIVKVDEKYYAFASSGNCGLLKLGEISEIKSTWDDPFEKNLSGKERKYSIIIGNNVRGKSVAYSSKKEKLYYATNLGLYVASPTEVKEITLRNKTFYVLKLQEFNNRIFALSTQGKLYEITEKNEPEQIFTNTEPIKNIKISGNYLFLINERFIHYFNLNDPEKRVSRIQNSVGSEEINDLTLVNNVLILAINKGVVFYNFKPIHELEKKMPFIITRFAVNNVLQALDEVGQLKAIENNIDINYAILSFPTSESITCFYRINGGQWQTTPSESRSLKFVSLPSGDYKIEFKLNNFPIEKKFISFSIAKPYWEQSWFILITILAGSSLLFLYYKWRVKSLQKQNGLLLEKIELEKNLGQSMLIAIKSQMNPHFFYNALNTIQSYIFSNDKKQAASYLNKFSKLTRLILEMSEKETVVLEEEIKALLLYLELEKGRFEDDFNFSINIDPSVDKDMIRIPSMMIQPYVENAIKHGLLHKKGNKELNISFVQHTNELVIIVSDNGIGRKQSNELNKIRKDRHSSFATGANLKRLEILNHGRANAIGVVYLDNYTESGLANGTTVNITIPLKSSYL